MIPSYWLRPGHGEAGNSVKGRAFEKFWGVRKRHRYKEKNSLRYHQPILNGNYKWKCWCYGQTFKWINWQMDVLHIIKVRSSRYQSVFERANRLGCIYWWKISLEVLVPAIPFRTQRSNISPAFLQVIWNEVGRHGNPPSWKGGMAPQRSQSFGTELLARLYQQSIFFDLYPHHLQTGYGKAQHKRWTKQYFEQTV